jgi:excisionase family DNA binding protein
MQPLWDIEQVAAFLNISKHTIRGKVSRREIPFVKIGRRCFFRPEAIVEWVKQHSVEPRPRREAP